MAWLYFTVIYLLFNFILYILVGRNLRYLRSELGIFLFHLLSFVFLGLLSFVLLIGDQKIIILMSGILSMHGIYSISFLELWSLSQGGYSLKILELSSVDCGANSKTLHTLALLGDMKFNSRINTLQKICLLRYQNHILTTTFWGAQVAKMLLIFVSLTNISCRG